ncbi:MAG: PepSY domain-containing protein [Gammaproteobacteria bacterium HGW-Gammaproteobacteria-11]|nr:MAG: PepSY domain-containing protein [Gammaproteobacteria bacterium HGW-Gammaproteobacteria-11]
MKTQSLFIGLALAFLSTASFADEDCDDPVTSWQPRENLRLKLEAEGWRVYRIKVDDGCYEVKGLAPEGYRVEAYFAPASLLLMEMEREDDDDHDDRHSHRSTEGAGTVTAPSSVNDNVQPSARIE